MTRRAARAVTIPVPVTAGERALLERAAELAGLPVSAYLRRCGLWAAVGPEEAGRVESNAVLLLSARDVAALIPFGTERTIAAWHRSGLLPGRRVGKSLVFKPGAVASFLGLSETEVTARSRKPAR